MEGVEAERRAVGACTLHGPLHSWLPHMACLLVRGSACAQGPPDGAARCNPLPPKVVALKPTIKACRRGDNGTAQDGRSLNLLLLFLVTARPLVSAPITVFMVSRHQ